MHMMPVKPEREAQLEDYARRHGQDAATALDDVLAKYLDAERQEYQEAVIGIREGYEDMKAGRMRDANQIFEELRAKHGFPS